MKSAIDGYVHDVGERIAPTVAGRSRIEADVRTHLEESVAAGASEAEAIARMGPPEDVARAYLEGVELVPARRTRRLGAFLLDMGLGTTLIGSLVLLAVVAVNHGAGLENVPLPLGIALAVTAAAVSVAALLYFPMMEALFGQTAGKRLFGIGVAREDGSRVGLGPALVRRIPLLFDFWPLDALFVFFTEKRQRAFDMVARTVVIEGGREHRGAWAWTALAWAVTGLVALGLSLLHGEMHN
ncbi:MAG TPA: RDD family protein [Gemmatimonadota bacterium]|nr:RDD family protein [Gemmatimonadota bacterium]